MIGRQLHMSLRTVKSLADAVKPEDLFRGQWQYNRTSALDEYKPYLDARWNEGCTNAWKLWEEVVPLGYQGSYGIVSAYIRKKCTSPRPVAAQPPAPRVVTQWILSRPESLTEIEQLRLKAVLANCPELDALTGHVRFFAQMLTERQGERLPQWLHAVRQDDFPSCTPLLPASTATATPSSLGSPCPGAPASSKDTSTGSRCSNDRCSAVRASISCVNGSCLPDLLAGPTQSISRSYRKRR
ncbi:hypothetical protein ACFUNF_04110 [Streptomyces sp. NPDC057291]|uniref:hypothetical protein n=1 Tax=Streptomyces sp. NPDC057291 TaxID=3346087 RepID=UPI0036311633